VRQTLKRGEPEFTGEVIDPPKILKYHRTLHLTNGLRYNLIDPYVPSSEAADRISMVAKMVGQAKARAAAITNSSTLLPPKPSMRRFGFRRIIAPKVETTVLDVYRIIAQDSAMQVSLTKLTDCITVLQQEKIQRDKAGRRPGLRLGKLITSYTDLGKFFTEEWLKLKSQGNTGTSIMSTISNLFGPIHA